MIKNLVFGSEPTDWRELQEYVKIFFSEMNFDVKSEIICQGARSSFEADVLAVRFDIGQQKILIECKHWNSPIPQDVVFSLYSRMQDIGATNGIIVSKCGFQSGAERSILNTPITLYTFDELISTYESSWAKIVLQKLHNDLSYLNSIEFDILFEYDELVIDDEYGFYSELQRSEFRKIISKYQYLFFINANMGSGICTDQQSYDDKYFINLVGIEGINVLGDFIRYFNKNKLIEKLKEEIEDFIKKSQAGIFADNEENASTQDNVFKTTPQNK